MKSRFNSHTTVYSEYIDGQIGELAKRGGGNYNFKEIASVLGLSPTHNLRKRLRTLEAHGAITITYGAIGDCSWCLLYTIPNKKLAVIDNYDIPF